MRYMIDGADRKTGREVKIVVEAATEAEAVADAHGRGLLVAGCVPERKSTSKPVATGASATTGGWLRSVWSRPAGRIGVIAAVVLLVGGVSAALWVRGHNENLRRELDARVEEDHQRQMRAAQKMDKQVEKENEALRKRVAENRARAAELRGADTDADAGNGTRSMTRAEALGNDPVAGAILDRYPDLRDMVLRDPSNERFSTQVQLLVSTGNLDATDAQRLFKIRSELRSLRQ